MFSMQPIFVAWVNKNLYTISWNHKIIEVCERAFKIVPNESL
jgi:hypothetical protein